MQVEPSEFARDLARISPELRCSPQIQFARAVARWVGGEGDRLSLTAGCIDYRMKQETFQY